MAFEALNRLKWTGKLGRAEIVFVHRGAPGDKKTVSGAAITSLKRSHFCYKDDDHETHIPNHRILEVRFEGRTIWKKKKSTPEG